MIYVINPNSFDMNRGTSFGEIPLWPPSEAYRDLRVTLAATRADDATPTAAIVVLSQRAMIVCRVPGNRAISVSLPVITTPSIRLRRIPVSIEAVRLFVVATLVAGIALRIALVEVVLVLVV